MFPAMEVTTAAVATHDDRPWAPLTRFAFRATVYFGLFLVRSLLHTGRGPGRSSRP
jgi:hypothetical protein